MVHKWFLESDFCVYYISKIHNRISKCRQDFMIKYMSLKVRQKAIYKTPTILFKKKEKEIRKFFSFSNVLEQSTEY